MNWILFVISLLLVLVFGAYIVRTKDLGPMIINLFIQSFVLTLSIGAYIVYTSV